MEHLTGWRGLLDQAEVIVTDDYRKSFFGLMRELGVAPGLWRGLGFRLLFQLCLAAYEPFSNVLVIHKRCCERSNLDGLKVILGHELVHVGQFRHTPGLLDQYRESLQWLKGKCGSSAVSLKELIESVDYSVQQSFMSQIEGYAAYIQGYLERYYNCAEIVPPRPLLVQLWIGLSGWLAPDLHTLLQLKREQYQHGREGFEYLDRNGGPVPFR